MSSIFLSHSHADKDFVNKLANDLQLKDYYVWIDDAEINLGDSLIQKIREGIDNVEYVGAIISKESIESEWVKKELDIAMNQEIEGKRVKVLPLLIDDVELPGFLKGKKFADFRTKEKYNTALKEITKRLGETSGNTKNMIKSPKFQSKSSNPTIHKAYHSAYYPFKYLVKWDNINKMKFGEDLRNKLCAIFAATEKEKSISLMEQHISTSFNAIYFTIEAGPSLSPFEVLEIIRNNVYCSIRDGYPEYRLDLLKDIWSLLDWNNKKDMDFVPYYLRLDVKYSKDILLKNVDGMPITDFIKEGIKFAVDKYNEKHENIIEVKYINFESHSIELVVACPLELSAAKLSHQIKGGSSYFLGKNYKQYFKDNNSPVFVSKESFWSRGKFYALSSYPIKELTQKDVIKYRNLKNMWETLKIETDLHKKGKLLEQFAENMFDLMNNFTIIRGHNSNYDLNLGFEQIDLTLKNKSDNLIRWGNFIKVECKNHAKPIGNNLIRDFSGKLRGDIRLGILISVNGFGKFDDKLLVRLLSHDKKLIVRISGDEIEGWLNKILQNLTDINQNYNKNLLNIEYMLEEKINRAELELI